MILSLCTNLSLGVVNAFRSFNIFFQDECSEVKFMPLLA